MEPRHLIDTNIAIHILNGDLPENALKKIQSLLTEECNLSIISKIEFLGWQFPNSDKQKEAENFIYASNVFHLSNQIADQAILIRRARKIDLPDAIIAATALVHGFSVVTRNVSDFSNIPGLNIINPFV